MNTAISKTVQSLVVPWDQFLVLLNWISYQFGGVLQRSYGRRGPAYRKYNMTKEKIPNPVEF